MQQTETYKLNLIESSDPFLPNALNENTRKIEEVMRDKTDAADHAALDIRVAELEKIQLACGCFIGDGVAGRIIPLGFKPVAVLYQIGNTLFNIVRDVEHTKRYMIMVDEGIMLPNASYNQDKFTYTYLAFGWKE